MGIGRVVNAMTVDVEDYFQVSAFDSVVPRSRWTQLESRVVANTERLLAIFADHGVTATFFVLGWIAERFPQVVSRIGDQGHEIASHGYGHELIYSQTPDQFRQDVRRAKALLEDASGLPVGGYRAPSFSITARSLWALDVLIEAGHSYDASIFPIRHDRYGMASAPRHPFVVEGASGTLVECPGSTIRVGPLNLPVAGGGYFRLLPYAWTRWGIARLNRDEGRPAIFYLHPWEIDADQPQFDVAWLGRIRHYRNLAATEGRLHRLLADFRFGPLLDVVLAAGLDGTSAARKVEVLA